jgi:hypothetical protein
MGVGQAKYGRKLHSTNENQIAAFAPPIFIYTA